MSRRTISLPLNPALTDQDVADVCTALHRILSYYQRTVT
jgi:dTDP-4-amino-4,6-dideoxygalactose transaminase